MGFISVPILGKLAHFVAKTLVGKFEGGAEFLEVHDGSIDSLTDAAKKIMTLILSPPLICLVFVRTAGILKKSLRHFNVFTAAGNIQRLSQLYRCSDWFRFQAEAPAAIIEAEKNQTATRFKVRMKVPSTY